MFGRRRLPSRSLLGPEPRIHAPKAGGRRQTRTFSAVAGSSLVIFMVLRSRSYCSQIARTVAEPDFFRGGRILMMVRGGGFFPCGTGFSSMDKKLNSNSVQKCRTGVTRTGGMQDRKNAGKVGCRTGEMQDR